VGIIAVNGSRFLLSFASARYYYFLIAARTRRYSSSLVRRERVAGVCVCVRVWLVISSSSSGNKTTADGRVRLFVNYGDKNKYLRITKIIRRGVLCVVRSTRVSRQRCGRTDE